MQDSHTVTWHPSGRGKAQCAPDPAYPHGVKLVAADLDQPHCTIELPYPAPECGQHLIECRRCGVTVMVTAAGRPDDPISATINCLPIADPPAA